MSPQRFVRTVVAAAFSWAVGSAGAAVITLDFEGLQDLEYIQDFYNGGKGSLGSTSATNYGISFGSNAQALIDADAGGSGQFENEPSPSTIMFFLSNSSVLNYSPGFTSGFSFYYTSVDAVGTVRVYDDVDGKGNLIGSISLPALGTNCPSNTSGAFCNFAIGSLAFNGTARSIDFGGAINNIGFDNITFGAATPGGPSDPGAVPEPGSLALVGAALAGAALTRRRRA